MPNVLCAQEFLAINYPNAANHVTRDLYACAIFAVGARVLPYILLSLKRGS